MRYAIATVCVVLLMACASGAGGTRSALKIMGLVIENQSSLPVSAVRLLVAETGNFVSCGNIGSGDMCRAGFPEATYTGYPVEITWSQAGRIHSTGQFVIQPPADIDVAKPAFVQVTITAPGSAGAIIVQGQQ